jgi:hypothetical protein
MVALALGACKQPSAENNQPLSIASNDYVTEISNAAIAQAFATKQSNIQVNGKGVVSKLLADDNKGSRHQKFLVKINAQQTLLFAHNIDLAPRVPLQVGDEVSFSGEYVYNPKGGIIHWTHRAPQGDHEAGWVMLNSKKYQ